MTDIDPLEQLLLDEAEVDRTRLAQALSGILGVDSGTGRLVLKPGFNSLTARLKVLAFLLGAKAAHLLGRTDTEAMTVKEVVDQSGMPRGTASVKLGELVADRVVSQTGPRGAYYVASPQVLAALSELQKRNT